MTERSAESNATATRPFELGGKVAAVTGAGSGIGRSVALVLARQGARVFVLDVDAEGGRSVVEQIGATGGAATFVRCDVTSASEVAEAFATLDRDAGRLDIAVNNAGVAHIGNLLNTSEAELDRIYAVNVKGVYHCLRHAVPLMQRSGGGAIVNLSSIAALIGLEDRFAYSMSKGAVSAITLSVARDYLSHGIRCNAVCPARVHTPFVDGFLARNFPGREREVFERLSRAQPIGRMGSPEEIAALVLYLCSDEAAFVTGSIYPIDGGSFTLR
ncbi:MAG TPA: glucose 1-dehydrogenase [Polyangiaceae bacterium]|nr:glucose 1-dehydrogenase [Polyangiaceae bacterium]